MINCVSRIVAEIMTLENLHFTWEKMEVSKIAVRAGIWVDGFSGMALETSLFIMQKKSPQ